MSDNTLRFLEIKGKKVALGVCYETLQREQFEMPILMANGVGPCDNFVSNGLSAAWNEQGQLLAQLDSEHESVLMVDTETQQVVAEQLPERSSDLQHDV